MMNLYTVLSFIVVLSAVIPGILCYSSGDVTAACTTMIPNHGSTPQTSPSPVEIKLSTTSYTAGSTVQVTIESKCGNDFNGFMIQARRADNNAADRTTPIGSFTTVSNTKQLCPNGANSALVHSASVARSSLSVKWTAPSSAQGHIVFKVTFVQIPKSIFWVGVTSEPVMDTTAAALNLAADSTATPTGCTSQVENKFAADTRCGDTIGCYSDCDSTGQCTYLATWVLDSPGINFTIKAIPNSDNNVYAAIGFSTDEKMGADNVIECFKTTGNTGVATSFNTGRSNTRNVNQIGITAVSAKLENKILECTFTREATGSGDANLFDLTTPYYMFFAQGTADSSKINQHGLTPTISPRAIDFKLTQNFSAVPADKTNVLNDVLQENKFAADTRCGDTIGCYSDCDSTGQCTYLATWVLDSPGINFIIKAIPNSDNNVYAAIGFSTDEKMGADNVIECFKTTGNTGVATSFNTGRSNTRNVNQIGITAVSAKLENKILECTFTREATGSGDANLFDLTTPYYMFFAQGTADSSQINQHGLTPTISPRAIDFKLTENFSAVPADKTNVLTHGALMIIAWITAASIGLVVARYFKPIWPNSTLIGQKIWFQIHRTCMIITLLSTCIAFIIIFIEVDGWTMSDITVEQAHPYLGVIVTFLTIVNPIMALFRPHPNTDNRYIFNWAHWGVGTAAYVLGIITVAIGTRMSKANLSENTVWIVVGFTVWQLIVVLCLELVQLLGNKQKTDSYELQGGQPEKLPVSDTSAKPENGTLKQAILIIHIVVVLAFTIALIVYIGLAQ